MNLITRAIGNPLGQRFHLNRSEARLGIRRGIRSDHRERQIRWMSSLVFRVCRTIAGVPGSPPRMLLRAYQAKAGFARLLVRTVTTKAMSARIGLELAI